MKHTLKGWLVDNAVTADDKEDKILMLESAGSLTMADIIEEMKKEDTGLRTETLEHALKLFNRVTTDLLLNGFAVNTGLFHAVPQFRGVIENGAWNPEKNSIYVSFTQDKELREAIAETSVLREAIAETSVNILGDKASGMYISGVKDAATQATDGTATLGRNFIITGRLLKIAGDDPKVGITFRNEDTGETALTADMISVNNPSQLVILIPTDLAPGEYTLTITTQHAGSSTMLKTPRSVSRQIVING